MFVKLLKSASIVLLVLNFMACSLFTPAVPAPDIAEIEKEEQAVYSFFVGGNTGTALILQNTSTNMADDNPQQTMDYIRSGLKGISDGTINSYLKRNAMPSQLRPDMQLGTQYVLLDEAELAEITRQPNWGQVLNEKYPNSHGYTMFSRVGFNNSLDQAVIYVGQMAGPLMGSGYYYLMEKQNGDWVIKQQVMVWIS